MIQIETQWVGEPIPKRRFWADDKSTFNVKYYSTETMSYFLVIERYV